VPPGAGSEAADNAGPLVGPSPPAGTRQTWLPAAAEAGLCAVALLFFPLLVLVPRGIAALVTVAGLLGAILVAAKSRQSLLHHFLTVAAALLVALAIWGLLSAAWSPDPRRSLGEGIRLCGLLVLALAPAAADLVAAPRRLASFLLAGFVVAIVLATVDLATNGAPSKPFSDRVYQPAWLNQASVGFAILLLPTGAALASGGQRLPGLVFTAVGATTIFALAGTAAKVALAAGIPCAIVCYYRRAPITRLAAVVTILAIVTAPLTFGRADRIAGLLHTADWVKMSAGHRLLIWSFVGDRIAERPLRGWGLEASRAIPGGGDPIRPGETWLPLHPHNAPLQIWLELGVSGAVLFSLLCGWIWCAVGEVEWPRLYVSAACGSLATAFVASTSTYGVWQEWWQGTLGFSLFMTLVMARVAGAGVSSR
jgi:exopolysaccharide production protein ExoQ